MLYSWLDGWLWIVLWRNIIYPQIWTFTCYVLRIFIIQYWLRNTFIHHSTSKFVHSMQTLLRLLCASVHSNCVLLLTCSHWTYIHLKRREGWRRQGVECSVTMSAILCARIGDLGQEFWRRGLLYAVSLDCIKSNYELYTKFEYDSNFIELQCNKANTLNAHIYLASALVWEGFVVHNKTCTTSKRSKYTKTCCVRLCVCVGLVNINLQKYYTMIDTTREQEKDRQSEIER